VLFPDSGSAAARALSAQLFPLDIQVDQSFQFILRRTASVFRKHRHHSNRSAMGNLDTFYSDFLIVKFAWLIYD
jgi:hypothetical protein